MDEATVAYKLGALDARVTGLQADVTEIKGDQKEQLQLLQRLAAKSAEGRGARKTLKEIAGYVTGSGVLAALLTWAFDHWVSK